MVNDTHELLEALSTTAALNRQSARSTPPQLFRNEDIAALETEKIWNQDWVCTGLASEIPDTGDYLTYSIASEKIFCIRDTTGRIRTFSNVCRHRMMQLLEGSGQSKRVTCPYHAWTYDLDGNLKIAGQMNEHKTFEKNKTCLPEFRTEIWHGWIYVTLNESAPPLSESLSALDKVVKRFNMSEYKHIITQDHEWDTNWKLLTENFMEGYHLPVAHKATVGAWMPVNKVEFPAKTYDAFTYQTFPKENDATYGRAHKDNKVLKGKWRNTSVMPTVFPSHMYVLAPDHFWYLSLRPNGIGKVMVRFGFAVAPEVYAAIEDIDAWTEEMLQFFDQVNAEDQHVVEGIFLGSESAFAESGPLSWLERSIHDFQAYLARRLCSDIA